MSSRPPIADDAKLTLVPSVVSTSIPGETVILDPLADRYFSLEGVGLRAWELLQRSTTFGALVRTITDEYEVDRATCTNDLRALVGELIERGLVVVDDAAQ